MQNKTKQQNKNKKREKDKNTQISGHQYKVPVWNIKQNKTRYFKAFITNLVILLGYWNYFISTWYVL